MFVPSATVPPVSSKAAVVGPFVHGTLPVPLFQFVLLVFHVPAPPVMAPLSPDTVSQVLTSFAGISSCGGRLEQKKRSAGSTLTRFDLVKSMTASDFPDGWLQAA